MALARFTRVSAAVWPVTSSRMNAAGTALSSPEEACLVVTCTDSALSLGTACVLVYCILAIRSGRTTMLYHSLSRQRDMPPQLRDASEASGRAGVNLSGHANEYAHNHRPSYATTGIIIYILCAYCNIIRNLTMYMS